jgi:hypothetical protein
MKSKHISIAMLVMATALSSCDGWIDNAKTPNNMLTTEQITTPSMLATIRTENIKDGAMIANVKTLAGVAASAAFLTSGAMTDEVEPTAKPNFLIYKQLKSDDVKPNSDVADTWNKLQNFRARAEEVLQVEAKLSNDGTENFDAVRAYARYTGHLYAGLAYQLLGKMFSKSTESAEGVRVNNQMVGNEELLDKAQQHYSQALDEAKGKLLANKKGVFVAATAVKQVRMLMVKLAMQRQRYAEAAALWNDAYANNMQVDVVYNINGNANPLYSAVGLPAINVQVDASLMASLKGAAEQKAINTAINKDGHRYLTWLEKYAPLVIIDEKEMKLIQAELIVRGLMQGDAAQCVNEVLALYSTGQTIAAAPTLKELAHLRHVFLFLHGCRIDDLRRAMVDGEAQAAWNARKVKYIPMPETEYK